MQVRNAYPLAIALAALMASPLALAQSDTTSATSQNATSRQPMTPLNSDISISTFNHLDTNHDGRVSAAEARADSSFNNSFRKLDADNNGYVSNDELTAASSNTTTGTASTTDASGTTTTTTSGSTATTPPVTYGNASDSTYESNNATGTSGTDTSTDTTTSSDTSGTNATDNGSTTTTTTKHKVKKHKSP